MDIAKVAIALGAAVVIVLLGVAARVGSDDPPRERLRRAWPWYFAACSMLIVLRWFGADDSLGIALTLAAVIALSWALARWFLRRSRSA